MAVNYGGVLIHKTYFLTILMLLLCSHSPNDVPPKPQQNISIAAVRGAVRLSNTILILCECSFIGTCESYPLA